MALGRPIPPLQLSREEHETLQRWGTSSDFGASASFWPVRRGKATPRWGNKCT
jgi:hypothetical protein